MKSILLAVLGFLLASSVWADEAAQGAPTVGPETTLNTAAHFLDSILVNALGSLELVAATPEARAGNWNGIKPYLQQLESKLPAVNFFVLPDGNYYSAALDRTNLNLSDRPYFKPLFAGNEIKGFPIFSRSSGRKSALVAVPIVADQKVTGALGSSVFLDELNERMNRAIVLPQGYTWYVLNADGNTMLHRDSDHIFLNALTQAGPSLAAAVAQAMKSDVGTIEYEMDGKRLAHFQKLPSMDWWMFVAKIDAKKLQPPPQLTVSLDRFVPDLQRSLDEIDKSVAGMVERSKADVASENELRKLLADIYEANTDVVDAAFVDAKGVMRYIAPRDYKNLENVDIGGQEHVAAMRKNPMPLLSGGFTAAENFLGVVVARPVFDSDKRFAGAVSILLRPDLLIDNLLKQTRIPEDYELWIMQPDGMIIYDQDKAEIGKMLFSDPVYAGYENLLKLGKKIAASPSGEGSYVFLAPALKEKVIKNAVWQTVRLHDREWRVVLAYRPYEK
jgi:hypothetical protein